MRSLAGDRKQNSSRLQQVDQSRYRLREMREARCEMQGKTKFRIPRLASRNSFLKPRRH